jgi:hypothetical protein
MAITSFRAGEAISAGQAIYVSTTGLIFKASSLTQDQASVVGIAIDSGVTGDLIRVNSDAIYNSYSGLTPGNLQYLSITTSGQLVDYATWAAQLDSVSINPYQEVIGRAITTSGVVVETGKPRYIVNPTSLLILESSVGVGFDALLLEDGSTIDLETASM